MDWANGPLTHLFGGVLADPRLSIEVRDVHDVVDDADQGLDGVLLDVDNGPDGFIQLANERLFSNCGVRDAYSAPRSSGVLAIRFAYDDALFVERLVARSLADEVKRPDAEGRERAPGMIWLAIKPS